MYIALLEIGVLVVNMSPPIMLVLLKPNIQPWLHNSIVVYYCCLIDVSLLDARVVAQSKDMPCPVQAHCMVVEGGQTQGQATVPPQWPFISLHYPNK